MENLRIIILTDVVGNGGAEREASIFANELVKYGYEIYIMCTSDAKIDYSVDSRVSIQLIPFYTRVNNPVVRIFIRWMNAFRLIRHIHADFILPFCVRPWLYIFFWLSTLFSKTKMLYLVRINLNQYKYPKEKRERKIGKLVAHLVPGIWIQTEEQRKYFPKYLQKKIFMVPNAIDTRFLRISKRERKSIVRFITVGRIHPQKNQKMLINAFEKMMIVTGETDVTLTIYGRSRNYCKETEEELKELIKRKCLGDHVLLPGWIEDIDRAYEEADAFVFSSDYEGMPNALMEAMAVGLPCISTDCQTGPSELITSGENGILVPVGDEDAMAEAMIYVVKNPMQALKMGENAKIKMQAWDTPEELTRRLLNKLEWIQKNR